MPRERVVPAVPRIRRVPYVHSLAVYPGGGPAHEAAADTDANSTFTPSYVYVRCSDSEDVGVAALEFSASDITGRVVAHLLSMRACKDRATTHSLHDSSGTVNVARTPDHADTVVYAKARVRAGLGAQWPLDQTQHAIVPALCRAAAARFSQVISSNDLIGIAVTCEVVRLVGENTATSSIVMRGY